MSTSNETNNKFDKRADALRANLMRRKKVKRDAADAKKSTKLDDSNSGNSVENKGSE